MHKFFFSSMHVIITSDFTGYELEEIHRLSLLFSTDIPVAKLLFHYLYIALNCAIMIGSSCKIM